MKAKMFNEKSVLQTILESLANDMNIKVREYSGRGMYGKKCLAFTTDRYMNLGSVFAGILRQNLPSIEAEDVAEAFESMSSDSMGLGMVYYFPDVEYIDGSEEEEDDVEEDLEEEEEG